LAVKKCVLSLSIMKKGAADFKLSLQKSIFCVKLKLITSMIIQNFGLFYVNYS